MSGNWQQWAERPRTWFNKLCLMYGSCLLSRQAPHRLANDPWPLGMIPDKSSHFTKTDLHSFPDVLKVVLQYLLLLCHHCSCGVGCLSILPRSERHITIERKTTPTSRATWWSTRPYLCSRRGRLQQPLFLPQAAGDDASNVHWLL